MPNIDDCGAQESEELISGNNDFKNSSERTNLTSGFHLPPTTFSVVITR